MMADMAVHVAILMKRYIDLILQGHKTVESRLTKTPRAPFGVIEPNDRIYFKCSAGPYMATAVAGDVESCKDLTPDKVSALCRKHNQAVCGDDQYWQAKRESRYATFMQLRDVEPIDFGPPLAPSSGIAWFLCQPDPLPESCFATLTDGALRNCYVRVPGLPVAENGDRICLPIELTMPDGQVITIGNELHHKRLLVIDPPGRCREQSPLQAVCVPFHHDPPRRLTDIAPLAPVIIQAVQIILDPFRSIQPSQEVQFPWGETVICH